MQEFVDFFFWAIGGDRLGPERAIGQMMVRAAIVFIIGVVVVRLGKRRFYGRYSALDLLMAIIVGAVLSRGINGSARFTETIAATFTLVLMHWLLASLAFQFDRFGDLIKGSEYVLVEEGEIQWDAMRASKIDKNDLLEALRSKGVEELDEVKSAYLERSGEVSVIRQNTERQ
ncbi:MAG: DUF421 domain-containing protein [Chloroflexota bacterium]|nr:DUF421 domain-containing protein [Chloroflexota bacterium]